MGHASLDLQKKTKEIPSYLFTEIGWLIDWWQPPISIKKKKKKKKKWKQGYNFWAVEVSLGERKKWKQWWNVTPILTDTLSFFKAKIPKKQI